MGGWGSPLAVSALAFLCALLTIATLSAVEVTPWAKRLCPVHSSALPLAGTGKAAASVDVAWEGVLVKSPPLSSLSPGSAAQQSSLEWGGT